MYVWVLGVNACMYQLSMKVLDRPTLAYKYPHSLRTSRKPKILDWVIF